MTATPKVSIVIPTYNAEETIGPLLESLLRLDYPDFEVIVVNDGSKDGTKDVVRRYPVRLVDQPNKGASAARDAGLRLASSEIVAYVDSDVAVTRDWLQKLIAPFSDPTVAATTGQTIFRRNQKCASWLRSLDIERRNAHRRTFTKLANGPNSAFRRAVLLDVGGFDPHWYHAEDTEVSYRLWRRGYRIRYVPEAIVYHVPEEDWKNYLRKRYRDATAFTRILKRYSRHAVLEDDFVSIGMKVQPPLFLLTLLLAALALLLLWTPWLSFIAVSLLCMFALAVILNVPEALAVARASRRSTFFFKGIGLNVLRGFVWGVGLGVGTIRHIIRAEPSSGGLKT